jgi:hypothetical protein
MDIKQQCIEEYLTQGLDIGNWQKNTEEQLQNKDELQQKIAILEKQLQWEKMRIFALDTMIDIAEKQLDISIRKKSGNQQSEK